MAAKEPTPIKGKGGNFSTSKNPFAQSRASGAAPELVTVPLLAKALDTVLQSGCAVLMGHTRDGGALVLTILDGQDRHRTYCASEDELEAAVKAMLDLYTEG